MLQASCSTEKRLYSAPAAALYIVQQTPHSLRQFADIIVVADRRAFADAAALILFQKRDVHRREQAVQIFSGIGFAAVFSKAVAQLVEPVSYTHLDLYKRQIMDKRHGMVDAHNVIHPGADADTFRQPIVIFRFHSIPVIAGIAPALSLIHI